MTVNSVNDPNSNNPGTH